MYFCAVCAVEGSCAAAEALTERLLLLLLLHLLLLILPVLEKQPGGLAGPPLTNDSPRPLVWGARAPTLTMQALPAHLAAAVTAPHCDVDGAESSICLHSRTRTLSLQRFPRQARWLNSTPSPFFYFVL